MIASLPFSRLLLSALIGYLTLLLWSMVLLPAITTHVTIPSWKAYFDFAGPGLLTGMKVISVFANTLVTVPLGAAAGAAIRFRARSLLLPILVAFLVGLNVGLVVSSGGFEGTLPGLFRLHYKSGDLLIIQAVAAFVALSRRADSAPPSNKLQRTRGGSFRER